jgi:hypothetical protein
MTSTTERYLMTTDGGTSWERVTRAMLMAVLDARGVSRWDRKQALAEALAGMEPQPLPGVRFRACC